MASGVRVPREQVGRSLHVDEPSPYGEQASGRLVDRLEGSVAQLERAKTWPTSWGRILLRGKARALRHKQFCIDHSRRFPRVVTARISWGGSEPSSELPSHAGVLGNL